MKVQPKANATARRPTPAPAAIVATAAIAARPSASPSKAVPKAPPKPAGPSINPGQLDEQVKIGFKRRDSAFLSEVFQQFATSGSNTSAATIARENIVKALSAANARVRCLDGRIVDAEGRGVDESTFKRIAVSADVLQQWLESLPLAQIIADAFPAFILMDSTLSTAHSDSDSTTPSTVSAADGTKDDDHDIIARLSQLTAAQIPVVVAAAMKGVTKAIEASIEQLKTTLETQKQRHSDQEEQREEGSHVKCQKFSENGRALTSGPMHDGHQGVVERIGEFD
jgi:hypothetical protein